MAKEQRTKKTSTITFRLDYEIIKKLQEESHDREISTNTLVNQALRRFLEWDMYQPKVGFILLNKPVFVEVFGRMKQKEIVDLATRVGNQAVRDIVFFMKGKIEIKSFMSWFEMRMINSSVQVSHSNENNSYIYIMKHDLGKNWSLYHKTILELIFEDLFKRSVCIKYNTNTLSFEFKE